MTEISHLQMDMESVQDEISRSLTQMAVSELIETCQFIKA